MLNQIAGLDPGAIAEHKMISQRNGLSLGIVALFQNAVSESKANFGIHVGNQ